MAAYKKLRQCLLSALTLMICFSLAACAGSKPDRPDKAIEELGKATSEPNTTHSPGPDLETTLAGLRRYDANCNGDRVESDAPVEEIAGELTGIMYGQWYEQGGYPQDCSGMFHRVLEEMNKRCPGTDFPQVAQYRDTRQLAGWYHDRGQLIIVQNPLQKGDLIKPGAVMFYGLAKGNYKNATIRQLKRKDLGIEHMGVVVRVEKDANGKVTNYHLFHGISSGKPSAITTAHFRDWSKSKFRNAGKYKSYGFWSQPWVAIAPLLPADAQTAIRPRSTPVGDQPVFAAREDRRQP